MLPTIFSMGFDDEIFNFYTGFFYIKNPISLLCNDVETQFVMY